MTSGKQLSVGLRLARVYELNSAGLPNATSTDVYEGVEIRGAKAYTLNTPEPRRISHLGNDRVLAVDFLPPTEGVTGELRASVHDYELNALLCSVKNFDIAEASLIPWITDKQGFESNVGLLLFQQSLALADKLRHWRFHISPSARVYPLTAGMDENASEIRYQFVPNPSAKHLWGTALAENTEGATEAALIEGMSEYKPHVVAWLADGTTTTFSFHTSRPCAGEPADKVSVWVNGVLSTGYTPSNTGITFSVAPDDEDVVVCYYEY